jgi:translation initiation factor 3 subunit G
MSNFNKGKGAISETQSLWADEDEEEFETPIDKNGFKQRVKVSVNSKGQKVRTTTKIRVREVKTRTPKRVLNRRNLPKFGLATSNDKNVTRISPGFVAIEHPDDQLTESAVDKAAVKSSLVNLPKIKLSQLELEHETEGGLPPSMESKEGITRDKNPKGDHENTIRVSNLSKRVTEEDLYDLFAHYGHVFRVSLPRALKKGEDGVEYREPRGFAYIAFSSRCDAEVAMEKLQGYGYDHLILNLEWAKPPSGDASIDRPQHRTGYGEELAQATKEQVFYASNLTGNTY